MNSNVQNVVYIDTYILYAFKSSRIRIFDTHPISSYAHDTGETHLVCLFCSAESAIKALSLALHSVPRVFPMYFARNSFNQVAKNTGILVFLKVAQPAPSFPGYLMVFESRENISKHLY